MGGIHGGGCAWWGACVVGVMHGGGMHDRGVHGGVCVWQGACMA